MAGHRLDTGLADLRALQTQSPESCNVPDSPTSQSQQTLRTESEQ